MQRKEGSRAQPRSCLLDLPLIALRLQHANYLCFQQHSSNLRLSTFVFIDIPASFPSFPQRAFVFIDIAGSFVQF